MPNWGRVTRETPTATAAHRAANEGSLLFRLADRAAIAVSGKDRVSWLNGLVTCDLAKDAAYGLLVEKKGKIQTDFFIARDADTLVLAVPEARREELVATLDHYLIMEDAEIMPVELAFFLLQGPAAGGLVERIAPAKRAALDLFGKGGFVLAVPMAEADALARAFVDAGAVLADDASWNAIRIEHGVPTFGVEFDTSFYPQEASIEARAVSFDKGCYLGQEVVYMLQNRGHVKKKLVALAVEGVEPLAAGEAITTVEGDAVGDVRSAVVAPSDGVHTAAIAMVKYAQAKDGAELRVCGRTARIQRP